MQKKMVIVADDFTGANDTGVQFRKAGSKVNVVININISDLQKAIEESDVVVIDLESRLMTPEKAYQLNLSVGKQLSLISDCIIYKKLDSTFRGNIGAEIDGLMDASGVRIALMAPALPVYGRTVEKGTVYVNKVKLADTEASRDPRNPVKHSRVVDIIALQSKRGCKEIPADFFDWEAVERKDFLVGEVDNGTEILLFDSREEADLENIARFIKGIDYMNFLLIGSAGLANQLSKAGLPGTTQLAFVFAGSTSEKTRSQINYSLQNDRTTLVAIEGGKLLSGNSGAEEIEEQVSSAISNGSRKIIFTSALTAEAVEKVFETAKQLSVEKDEAAGILSLEMGRLAARIIKKFNPSGVLLTGGETAINIVTALEATGIEIDLELFPGVQSGRLTGCAVKTTVVTKAGGFGEPDAISTIFKFFKV